MIVVKLILEKITNIIYFLKKNLFWIVFFFDIILLIIGFIYRGWLFVYIFLFICSHIFIQDILEKRPKKLNITEFMPGKPEKDSIRYLRGKRAKEYQIALDKTNTYLEVGDFRKFFCGLRRIFYNLTGLRKSYFIERPWYDAKSRRLLDLFYINTFNDSNEDGSIVEHTLIQKIRYKYLRYRYRKEYKKFNYWIRITNYKIKRVIYVWHEDIDLYKKLYSEKEK